MSDMHNEVTGFNLQKIGFREYYVCLFALIVEYI